jgi:hypothetical protein
MGGILAAASCAVEVGPPVHEVVYESGTTGDPVYVNEAPPAPREDVVIGVAPAPGYVWIGGYWARRPSGWVWINGRWSSPPRPGVVWVPGRWEHHPRGHVWISGHWR